MRLIDKRMKENGRKIKGKSVHKIYVIALLLISIAALVLQDANIMGEQPGKENAPSLPEARHRNSRGRHGGRC